MYPLLHNHTRYTCIAFSIVISPGIDAQSVKGQDGPWPVQYGLAIVLVQA